MSRASCRAAALLALAVLASTAPAADLRKLEDALIALEDEQGSISPAVRDARYTFAKALLEANQDEDAAAQLRLVVYAFEEDPAAVVEDSLPARIDLGETLRTLGAHEEAIGAYQGALELARDLGRDDVPRLAEARLGLGTCAAARGQCSLALEALDAARAGTPAGPARDRIDALRLPCLRSLAGVEREALRLKEARAYAEQAIALVTETDGADAPALAPLHELAGMILAEAGEGEGARAQVQRAGQLREQAGQKDDPWNRTAKAVVLDFAGEAKKANAWFKHAAQQAAEQHHPQYGPILDEFARFLLRHGKTAAAKKVRAKRQAWKAPAGG